MSQLLTKFIGNSQVSDAKLESGVVAGFASQVSYYVNASPITYVSYVNATYDLQLQTDSEVSLAAWLTARVGAVISFYDGDSVLWSFKIANSAAIHTEGGAIRLIIADGITDILRASASQSNFGSVTSSGAFMTQNPNGLKSEDLTAASSIGAILAGNSEGYLDSTLVKDGSIAVGKLDSALSGCITTASAAAGSAQTAASAACTIAQDACTAAGSAQTAATAACTIAQDACTASLSAQTASLAAQTASLAAQTAAQNAEGSASLSAAAADAACSAAQSAQGAASLAADEAGSSATAADLSAADASAACGAALGAQTAAQNAEGSASVSAAAALSAQTAAQNAEGSASVSAAAALSAQTAASAACTIAQDACTAAGSAQTAATAACSIASAAQAAVATETTNRTGADIVLSQRIDALATGTTFLPVVKVATEDGNLQTAVNDAGLATIVLPLGDDAEPYLTMNDFWIGDRLLSKYGALSKMWFVYSTSSAFTGVEPDSIANGTQSRIIFTFSSNQDRTDYLTAVGETAITVTDGASKQWTFQMGHSGLPNYVAPEGGTTISLFKPTYTRVYPAGTTVFTNTAVDPNTQVYTQLTIRDYIATAADFAFKHGDAFVVQNDVVDAGLEGAAIYYASVNASGCNVFKLADLDWSVAAGIGISAISGIDALTVQGALAELDGDIKAEATLRTDADTTVRSDACAYGSAQAASAASAACSYASAQAGSAASAACGYASSQVASLTLNSIYQQDADSDGATISTDATGPVVIGGDQSLKITATNGLDMTDKAITTTTSNGHIMIARNGAGGLVMSYSGDPAAGCARGTNAIDLQVSRGSAIYRAVGNYTVVLGENNTTIANSDNSFVAGKGNTACGYISVISGGWANITRCSYGAISGGQSNCVWANHASIGGGSTNAVDATGLCGTVAGGHHNLVSHGGGAIPGGAGATTAAANDLVIGNNSTASAAALSNNHFRVAGDNSDVHIGRQICQASVADASNKLQLHSIGASLQQNAVAVKAPDDLAASYTITLPGNDGDSGQYLQTNGSGVTTWAAVAAPIAPHEAMICLSSAQVAAKCFDLPGAPASSGACGMMVVPVGGLPQFRGIDFSVTGTAVCWNALCMEALGLVADDKIYVVYFS